MTQKRPLARYFAASAFRQLGDIRRNPPRQTVLRLFGPKEPTSDISYTRSMDWGQVSILFGIERVAQCI
jgi:hypothetical protein